MRPLVWTPAFLRALRRRTRHQPELREAIRQTLRQLADDPFHPTLRTHKLTGQLSGVWACRVDYDLRVLFEFAQNEHTGTEEILLLTVGSHDEVY
jgi:addiction module RelE/StbE family toxin